MNPALSASEQLHQLLRGTVSVHTKEELEKKLKSGKPLRVKLGIDPSAPHIHLGHTVVLRKLRQFQDLGHQAVLIVGDFTALVGDPTGRSRTRPHLTPQQVEENARTYLDQVGKVLDMEKVELVRNSKWLKPMSFYEIVQLTGKVTVAQILERDDFSKRHNEGTPIGLHEFLYPVMQGYDSVVVRADVELGGTDQLFNLLVGRDLMKIEGQDPQVAMTLPILPGLDGVQRMSKTYGNHIGVAEDAFEIYSKVMRLPDTAMKEYFTLLTELPLDEIERLCDFSKTHPKAGKDRLAREVAAAYHDRSTVDEAAEKWDKLFSKREIPEEAPDLAVPGGSIRALELLMLTKIPRSKSDGRRLLEQGAAELDGTRITDPAGEVAVKNGMLLRVGKKKKFFRIKTS